MQPASDCASKAQSSDPLRSTEVTGLNAQRWGEGVPRFLFIHGLGDGCFIWHHIVPSLAHLGAAMAVDLRGHGDSPRDPLETYAVHTHVLDVLATLRRACPEPVIVVGHSIGAEIAMRVAIAQPGWVRRLVLVDGGPELDDAALEAFRRQFSEQPWSYSTIEEYAQRLRQNLPLAAPPLLRLVAAQALRADPAGGFRLKCDRALVNCLGSKGISIWPLFRAISIPMLAIRGAGSAMLSRSVAVRMTRENPRCVLQSVPLAGHAVMLDNPLGLLAALRAGL